MGRSKLQTKGEVTVHELLQYLKQHGERLDAEIAEDLGISLEQLHARLSELSGQGEVILCRTTRFTEGRKVEGVLCRVSGYSPSMSPGRKPKQTQ